MRCVNGSNFLGCIFDHLDIFFLRFFNSFFFSSRIYNFHISLEFALACSLHVFWHSLLLLHCCCHGIATNFSHSSHCFHVRRKFSSLIYFVASAACYRVRMRPKLLDETNGKYVLALNTQFKKKMNSSTLEQHELRNKNNSSIRIYYKQKKKSTKVHTKRKKNYF